MAHEGESDHTHRPCEGAQYEWLGFFLGVLFHPPLKLAPKDAHQFAAALNEFYDIDLVNLESDTWIFTSTRYEFEVKITQAHLELQSSRPTEKLERYEIHYKRVLERFGEHFSPQVILASKATIPGLLDIDGDARTFLAQHVFRLLETRLDPFERPLHLLGMRAFFPAVDVVDDEENKTTIDWDVDVRIESAMADPRKLYVRAEATWGEPAPWDDESLQKLFGRLSIVSDYISTTINGFLRYEDTSE